MARVMTREMHENKDRDARNMEQIEQSIRYSPTGFEGVCQEEPKQLGGP